MTRKRHRPKRKRLVTGHSSTGGGGNMWRSWTLKLCVKKNAGGHRWKNCQLANLRWRQTSSLSGDQILMLALGYLCDHPHVSVYSWSITPWKALSKPWHERTCRRHEFIPLSNSSKELAYYWKQGESIRAFNQSWFSHQFAPFWPLRRLKKTGANEPMDMWHTHSPSELVQKLRHLLTIPIHFCAHLFKNITNLIVFFLEK